MEKKEYLNEEKYQKNKKKIMMLSLIILIIGCLIGGSLILVGVNKNKEVDSKNSSDSKEGLTKQIEDETKKLEDRKEKLEEQGIKYNVYAKYTDGKEYELKIITDVLDPSLKYYHFAEYKNNNVTSKYCSLMEQKEQPNDDFSKSFDKTKNTSYFMLGGMIILMSIAFAGSVFMIAKRREIMAFQAQQIMPVAQEGIEKMAPSIGKVGKAMVDEMAPAYKDMAKEMAPVYGDIAKEVAKGVKEGMKEDNEDK